MQQPRVRVYGVYEKSEEGGENAAGIVETAVSQLAGLGLEAAAAPALVCDEASALEVAQWARQEDADCLAAVVINWSFDNLSLKILRRAPCPLGILCIPGIRSGSIVGAQQLGCTLTEMGLEHAVFYGPPEDAATYPPLAAYARAAAVRRRMQLGRIGNIGRRTPGMTPASFDEMEVTCLFGPTVATWGWDEIDELARAVAPADVEAQRKRVASLCRQVRSSAESLEDAVRLYLALRGLAQREGLMALAVGCYPHYAGRACLAAALLGDEGIPCGCEGDMNSTVAMTVLRGLTGLPVHFGEVLALDEQDNMIVTSHCGCAPPSLAADPDDRIMCPVRLQERGAVIRFPARGADNPATFVNLVGRKGTYRLFVAQGRAITCGMLFEGNPAKIRLEIPVREFLCRANAEGMAHHWMMAYGHVAEALRHFCRMTGLKGIFV